MLTLLRFFVIFVKKEDGKSRKNASGIQITIYVQGFEIQKICRNKMEVSAVIPPVPGNGMALRMKVPIEAETDFIVP